MNNEHNPPPYSGNEPTNEPSAQSKVRNKIHRILTIQTWSLLIGILYINDDFITKIIQFTWNTSGLIPIIGIIVIIMLTSGDVFNNSNNRFAHAMTVFLLLIMDSFLVYYLGSLIVVATLQIVCLCNSTIFRSDTDHKKTYDTPWDLFQKVIWVSFASLIPNYFLMGLPIDSLLWGIISAFLILIYNENVIQLVLKEASCSGGYVGGIDHAAFNVVLTINNPLLLVRIIC